MLWFFFFIQMCAFFLWSPKPLKNGLLQSNSSKVAITDSHFARGKKKWLLLDASLLLMQFLKKLGRKPTQPSSGTAQKAFSRFVEGNKNL